MSQLRGNLDDRRENVGSSVYTHFSIAPQKPIWPHPSKLFPPETFRRIDQISPPDSRWSLILHKRRGGLSVNFYHERSCNNPLYWWKKSIIWKSGFEPKKEEVEMKYQFPPPLLNSSTISVILIIFVAIIVIIIRDYVQTLNDVCSILSPLSIHWGYGRSPLLHHQVASSSSSSSSSSSIIIVIYNSYLSIHPFPNTRTICMDTRKHREWLR